VEVPGGWEEVSCHLPGRHSEHKGINKRTEETNGRKMIKWDRSFEINIFFFLQEYASLACKWGKLSKVVSLQVLTVVPRKLEAK